MSDLKDPEKQLDLHPDKFDDLVEKVCKKTLMKDRCQCLSNTPRLSHVISPWVSKVQTQHLWLQGAIHGGLRFLSSADDKTIAALTYVSCLCEACKRKIDMVLSGPVSVMSPCSEKPDSKVRTTMSKASRIIQSVGFECLSISELKEGTAILECRACGFAVGSIVITPLPSHGPDASSLDVYLLYAKSNAPRFRDVDSSQVVIQCEQCRCPNTFIMRRN